MALPAATQGVGKAMGAFSLVEEKELGYKAIQFNIVVTGATITKTRH